MIGLGILLLLLGLLLDAGVFWTLGILLVVIGAILYAAGSLGHTFAGRRHWW